MTGIGGAAPRGEAYGAGRAAAAAPRRAVRRYPRLCLEEKRYPDGRRNRFRARVLLLRPRHGVLHFVSDRAYDVGGLYLPRGTVTFGLFWEDRPYNLYAWMAPDLAAPRALYFNVCDRVALTAHRFDWRDLWVDILITPHAAPQVLDRHEIPATAPPPLRAAIDAAVWRSLGPGRPPRSGPATCRPCSPPSATAPHSGRAARRGDVYERLRRRLG